MESARIAELLRPFTREVELPSEILSQLRLYLELLLRWNARVNLTAVRESEQIVTRHFGESLFVAKLLFGHSAQPTQPQPPITLADIGSGAGFPGIPIKLWAPHVALTLIESQNKKATFLREVVRWLKLEGAQVFCGRAEQWGQAADVVTLRAVGQFERVLPVAMKLVAPAGRLCLLIGARQVDAVRRITGEAWTWSKPEVFPQSEARVVAIGQLVSPAEAGSGKQGQ